MSNTVNVHDWGMQTGLIGIWSVPYSKQGDIYYYLDWYYLGTDGVMQTGWIKLDDNIWYYFKPDGSMAANEYCGGYWLGASGTWTYQHKAQWKKDPKGWYYQDSTGWYAKNCKLTIDGKEYNFNTAGYCTNP